MLIGKDITSLTCCKIVFPKGTILAPLPFFLHVNELPVFLAVDTNIVLQEKTKTELNEKVKDNQAWFPNSWFFLNFWRTQLVHSENQNLHLKFGYSILSDSEVVEHLGILVNCILKFEAHNDVVFRKKQRFICCSARPFVGARKSSTVLQYMHQTESTKR